MYPNIKQYIAGNGVKLVTVCEYLGLTYQGLRNKLDGKTDFKADEIVRLAKWWGVTTDWLLADRHDV